MKEELKAEYWLKCWIDVANSASCTNIDIPTVYADRMLKDFDERFKVDPKSIDHKSEE